MPPDAPKLGILAGGGELPRLLIQSCRDQGRGVFVIAFKGQCDAETVEGVDHAWVRLGAAGASIKLLKDNGVTELVMAGHIRRPSMAALMPDARAIRFLAGGAMNKGDDGLLRSIISGLEREEGFRMVGVHDVMPELLSPEGPIGHIAPNVQDQHTIDVAVKGALDLGAADKGQAAVALDGAIVALEDQDGTDAMLRRLGKSGQARGGVLAKMTKPGQERRADLPAIGQLTVQNAHAAGLKGIVVEAGGSIIVGRGALVETADALGLFVVGVTR
ncbi:LpxI family protein [Magnetovibrio sp.]|uniref:LpxI family protein n=1 Tax=Magnetovibrio sp. TaxID=2024836 RepID=UPI002F929C71